jgi:hypothetical protein
MLKKKVPFFGTFALLYAFMNLYKNPIISFGIKKEIKIGSKIILYSFHLIRLLAYKNNLIIRIHK